MLMDVFVIERVKILLLQLPIVDCIFYISQVGSKMPSSATYISMKNRFVKPRSNSGQDC